jgi:ribosomal protein L24
VRRDCNQVVIAGVNIVKKKMPPAPNASEEEKRGGNILHIESGVHVSNVSHLHPTTMKPTKVGMKLVDGRWLRVSKLDEAAIPYPIPEVRQRVMGPFDTEPKVVTAVTFRPSLLAHPIPKGCNHL